MIADDSDGHEIVIDFNCVQPQLRLRRAIDVSFAASGNWLKFGIRAGEKVADHPR